MKPITALSMLFVALGCGQHQPAAAAPPSEGKAGKHVLLVLANEHFFYREYADPKTELERAGMKVTIAAGVKGACRPHDNSGQGAASGIVQADLALADVKADNYDAVVFAGGYGGFVLSVCFHRALQPSFLQRQRDHQSGRESSD